MTRQSATTTAQEIAAARNSKPRRKSAVTMRQALAHMTEKLASKRLAAKEGK